MFLVAFKSIKFKFQIPPHLGVRRCIASPSCARIDFEDVSEHFEDDAEVAVDESKVSEKSVCVCREWWRGAWRGGGKNVRQLLKIIFLQLQKYKHLSGRERSILTRETRGGSGRLAMLF